MDPEQLLNPVVLVPIAVVVVVLLGVAIAVVKVMSGKKAARQRKLWAQGAYSIWTGGEDCVSPARRGGLFGMSLVAHSRRHEDQCRPMG